ncbi:hypothetical protein ACIBEF_10340 [Micromonospora sp. NPDC050795]|uniref:hypothetical protein n=1 Tax=Micromonospora sp. NPDC050795 TaxID=3364282 RepID=UPI0037B57FC1
MPTPDHPTPLSLSPETYRAHVAAVRREIAALDEGAVLVGHSVGGTILVYTLAERPPERALTAIVLVAAPFVITSSTRI